MDLVDGLERLAPEVDEAAAWALFEKRRTRRRRRRTGIRAMGASSLAVVCVLLVIAIQSPEVQRVETSPQGQASQSGTESTTSPEGSTGSREGDAGNGTFGERVEFEPEMLFAAETSVWLDQTEVIVDQASWEVRWSSHGFGADDAGGLPPSIDFDASVAILTTLAQSPCPANVRLVGEGDTLWMIFDDDLIPCHLRATTMAYLVVVPRDLLPTSFTLRRTHPAIHPEDFGAERLTIADGR